MVWNRRKLKTAVVASLVALTLATNDFSFARVLGPVCPILEQIASLLDKVGIDVSCCNAQEPPGERPRVQLLSDIPLKQPTSFEKQSWLEEFNRGAFGRIGFVSVPAFTATNAAEEQFRSASDHADQNQGIFISFAGVDNEYANKIEDALERAFARLKQIERLIRIREQQIQQSRDVRERKAHERAAQRLYDSLIKGGADSVLENRFDARPRPVR